MCSLIKTECLHYLSFIALENKGKSFYGDDDNNDDEGERNRRRNKLDREVNKTPSWIESILK